jgi:hypothetical protein
MRLGCWGPPASGTRGSAGVVAMISWTQDRPLSATISCPVKTRHRQPMRSSSRLWRRSRCHCRCTKWYRAPSQNTQMCSLMKAKSALDMTRPSSFLMECCRTNAGSLALCLRSSSNYSFRWEIQFHPRPPRRCPGIELRNRERCRCLSGRPIKGQLHRDSCFGQTSLYGR